MDVQEEEYAFEKFQHFYMQVPVYVCMWVLYEDPGFGHPYTDRQVKEAAGSDNTAILQ